MRRVLLKAGRGQDEAVRFRHGNGSKSPVWWFKGKCQQDRTTPLMQLWLAAVGRRERRLRGHDCGSDGGGDDSGCDDDGRLKPWRSRRTCQRSVCSLIA